MSLAQAVSNPLLCEFMARNSMAGLPRLFLDVLYALSDQTMPSASAGFRHAGNPHTPHPFEEFLMNAINAGIPDSLKARHLSETLKEIATFLSAKRFWWVGNAAEADELMIYDTTTKLLWDGKPNAAAPMAPADGKLQVAQLLVEGLAGWRLPSNVEIVEFAEENNPLKKGPYRRLLGQASWLEDTGYAICTDDFDIYEVGTYGCVLACNDFLAAATPEMLIQVAMQRQWSLKACDETQGEDVLKGLSGAIDLKAAYRDVDHLSVRLPKLESAQFTDPNKGLWEFWGMAPQALEAAGVRARNPALDVKESNVVIDFGTSSTVVAYDDKDQHKLLRIGGLDYWAQEQAEDYENPTVLEFIDIPGLLKTWRSEAYRPGVDWDQVRCSHVALKNFRDNKSNPRVVASTLSKIKQWALREAEGGRVRITDRHEPGGIEHELAPLTLRVPVRGQALCVSEQDPFDPVELYAWFLGMMINWRGRGIFLRYYMSFPVAYPKEVKDRILASFRRGLQRSLPASLLDEPIFQRFMVEERASEPAAYAASALQCLGIEPTREGVAYAVFDFGGGTADFDFGYYRLPTDDEMEEGKERVFEHFGSAGDCFLGGENLLENMTYLTLRHNLLICRSSRIAFTRPLDADDFAGAEMFLEHTQAASTNTVMLMAALRPLWETGAMPENSTSMLTIDLLDRDGDKVPCQLAIPQDLLKAYLEERIGEGVRSFLVALKKAFAQGMPEHIHVLLAGNASRSRWVSGFCGLQEGDEEGMLLGQRMQAYIDKLFDGQPPRLIPHAPLPIDENDLFRPTAKTGVALGLLQLCPGSPVKVINRAWASAGEQAPFAHYVGQIRQRKFQVRMAQGGDYGVWQELGIPSEGVFNLYHTQSPLAHTGEMRQGEAGLCKKRLDLVGDL